MPGGKAQIRPIGGPLAQEEMPTQAELFEALTIVIGDQAHKHRDRLFEYNPSAGTEPDILTQEQKVALLIEAMHHRDAEALHFIYSNININSDIPDTMLGELLDAFDVVLNSGDAAFQRECFACIPHEVQMNYPIWLIVQGSKDQYDAFLEASGFTFYETDTVLLSRVVMERLSKVPATTSDAVKIIELMDSVITSTPYVMPMAKDAIATFFSTSLVDLPGISSGVEVVDDNTIPQLCDAIREENAEQVRKSCLRLANILEDCEHAVVNEALKECLEKYVTDCAYRSPRGEVDIVNIVTIIDDLTRSGLTIDETSAGLIHQFVSRFTTNDITGVKRMRSVELSFESRQPGMVWSEAEKAHCFREWSCLAIERGDVDGVKLIQSHPDFNPAADDILCMKDSLETLKRNPEMLAPVKSDIEMLVMTLAQRPSVERVPTAPARPLMPDGDCPTPLSVMRVRRAIDMAAASAEPSTGVVRAVQPPLPPTSRLRHRMLPEASCDDSQLLPGRP